MDTHVYMEQQFQRAVTKNRTHIQTVMRHTVGYKTKYPNQNEKENVQNHQVSSQMYINYCTTSVKGTNSHWLQSFNFLALLVSVFNTCR